MQTTAVFTVISNNYMAFARTLMQSLAEIHPEWQRHVLLVDRSPQEDFLDNELFTTTFVEELPLPNIAGFLFRYSIMELNTAVKPWMFARLMQKGYQQVIYLDPDILVLQPLADVERLLRDGATAVLTPHLTAPLLDNHHPAELDIMRAGAYNLGFLAVGKTPQAAALIRWWQSKLEFQAIVDLEKGLFTDQKWLDLAPGLFEGIRILRDSGYNVAYWNLSHRPITREGEKWHAGGSLLRFFHFSGFNPDQPGPFSKHQDRFNLESLGAGKELVMQYADQLFVNGHSKLSHLKYAFGYFDDGTPIPDSIRTAYRDNIMLQKSTGNNPFSMIDLFTTVPPSGLPPLLLGILKSRKDLIGYFPDPEATGRQLVFEWFIQDYHAQLGIPEQFILPIRKAVGGAASKTSPGMKILPRQNKFSWGGVLEYLHHSWIGVPPSIQRLQQYRSIRSARQFMAVGNHQVRRYFRGRGNRLTSLLLKQPSTPTSLPLEQSGKTEFRQDKLTNGAGAPLPGVNVVGYVRSEHGVGQSSRLFSNALTAVGHPHLLIDFNIGNTCSTNDTSLNLLTENTPRYPVNVFHINADQMPVVFQNLSPAFFKDRYNIGFWHWELPEFPDTFLTGFNGLHEVWVPTGFVHDAVSKKSSIPVVKMPHAIHFSVDPCCREDFGLPEKRFLFLTMYDFLSYQERKNPKGALDAFDQAFDRTDNRVALVIKTQNSHHHPQAREELKEWLADRENVIWLDKTLTRQEVYNLESLCDSYLSLHRSEGFGLGPAEAMFLGKPVIATNWSANTEFMRQDNSLPVNYKLITIEKSIGVYEKGQNWADPDIEHAAWLMRQVVNDQDLYNRISCAAQQSIRSELSPHRIGRMHQERLRFIQMHLL